MFGLPLWAIWFGLKNFATAAIPAVRAFARTWIGGVLIAAVVSGLFFHHRATKIERAVCKAAADRSIAVAGEIDRGASTEALFNMTKQVLDLQELKANADAENDRLRKQRRARPKAAGDTGCMPSESDYQRMRAQPR
ncbi:hypothetical protein IZ6_07850 [Terrihabitans soli]|uniref:Uncharacterized protein n=1 Tax=Terrihabitans soli TaxID=708113 RepID=A0A6S6QSX9_9HYPH|nr:hypothetical protein [Terrihabitans soli]BCJ90050.1 hypothetical protein IZ6_07850 [Terrihabitans soli]